VGQVNLESQSIWRLLDPLVCMCMKQSILRRLDPPVCVCLREREKVGRETEKRVKLKAPGSTCVVCERERVRESVREKDTERRGGERETKQKRIHSKLKEMGKSV